MGEEEKGAEKELNKNSSIIGAVPDTLRLSVNTESRREGGYRNSLQWTEFISTYGMKFPLYLISVSVIIC